MNRRKEHRYRVRALNSMREKIGLGYKLGARGMGDPEVYDCRGAVEESWIEAGAGEAIGGRHADVRHEYSWGQRTGNLLPPDAPMKKADLLIYNEPAAMPGPVDNPLCIRHVAMFEYPPSAEYPDGQAISALNKTLGVARHKINGLRGQVGKYVVLNILRANLDLVPVADESGGEPPVPEQ